ncbi:MAG: hypothetical protein EOP84_29810, partial [Verrucomicrobiaceae bacterium]
MPLPSDIRVREAELFFLPIQTRVPLKFGAQVVTQVTCARVRIRVEDCAGRTAEGWGETPLSVAWVWPSELSWEERESRLRALCGRLVQELVSFEAIGHPMEVSHRFMENRLHSLLAEENAGRAPGAYMPHLASLVCFSLFDLALY